MPSIVATESPVVALLAGLACHPAMDPGDGITDVRAHVSEIIGSIVVVHWTQRVDQDVAVAYAFGDGTSVTPTVAGVAGHNEARLLGIPFGTEVTYEVRLGDSASAPESIATDPLPAELPVAELVVSDDARWDSDVVYVLASVTEAGGDWRGPWWTVIFDRLGRIVWARRTGAQMVTIYPQVSADGSLLVDENSFWGTLDQGIGSSVHRLQLDGTEEAIHPTPRLHHGFAEDGSGAIVWPAWRSDGDTIDRLTKRGVQETVWDCASLQELTGTNTVCGANTITWQSSDDCFLVSFFSLDAVVEIDASTGANRCWFGALQGAWAFDPSGAGLWWPHGATYTDEGTLLVLTRSGTTGTTDNETVVREYVLDAADAVLELDWIAGDGDGFYSDALGEAHRLGNGNTLYNYGHVPRVREVTSAGELVWDVAWPDSAFVGLTTPLADLYALR